MLALLSLTAAIVVCAETDEVLPRIGRAPAFTLTTQDGARLSLHDLRGKVVAVTFIYAP